MTATKAKPATSCCRDVPREVVVMVAIALGLFVAVGTGSLIAAEVHNASSWKLMLIYAVPGALALATTWMIARRRHS